MVHLGRPHNPPLVASGVLLTLNTSADCYLCSIKAVNCLSLYVESLRMKESMMCLISHTLAVTGSAKSLNRKKEHHLFLDCILQQHYCFKNLSFSGREMMNPLKRHISYWILIMYTPSQDYPSTAEVPEDKLCILTSKLMKDEGFFFISQL